MGMLRHVGHAAVDVKALGRKLRMPFQRETAAAAAGIACLVINPVGQPCGIKVPQDLIKAFDIFGVGRKPVITGHVGHHTAKAVIADSLHLQTVIGQPFVGHGADAEFARGILKQPFIGHDLYLRIAFLQYTRIRNTGQDFPRFFLCPVPVYFFCAKSRSLSVIFYIFRFLSYLLLPLFVVRCTM